MIRSCDSCAADYDAQRPSSRFCSERCRKRAQRGHLAEPGGEATEQPKASNTRMRVERDLEAAGRLDTYLGECALALAERVDSATAVMGYAGLVKELRTTMEAAMAGVQLAADPVDELRAARDRKYGVA